MSEEDGHIVVMELTIGRVIDSEGNQGFYLSTDRDSYSFVEVLGLLEAAKWKLYQQMQEAYGD